MRPLRSTFYSGLFAVCALAQLAAGCAPVQTDPNNPDNPNPTDPTQAVTYELKRPTLSNIAPTSVSLGDTVTVFGKDFIDKDHGKVTLHMSGSFRSNDGSTLRGDYDIPLTYVSPGKATFEFGPSIFFSQTGLDLGTYSGNFQAVNTLTTQATNAEPGDMQISEVAALSMTAMPSIYVEQMRSVDDNCDLLTAGTTAGSNVAIGVRAIGMSGTAASPVHFSFTFNAPDVTLSFAENKVFGFWPLISTPNVLMDADAGNHTVMIDATSDNAVTLDPLHYQQIVKVSPPVVVNQVSTDTVKLGRIAAGPLQNGQDQTSFNVVVAARTDDGTTMTRIVSYKIFNQLEMDAGSRVEKDKEVYDLTQTNCSSGGLTGQQYSYSEGTSDSRTRSITMTANTMIMGSLDINVWIARASASSSQTFGYDVNKAETTESHVNYTSTINVLPSYVGASYRQPIRSEVSVPAVLHNTCGVTTPVGTLVMTNWRWNYDINQGTSCQDVLPSKQALTPGTRN